MDDRELAHRPVASQSAMDLGTGYDPSWRGYPPHMSPLDGRIWSVWAPTQLHRWRTLYFDVGLGAGATVPVGTATDLARMWTRLTQKRADVVADAVDHWELIECRSAAQSNALGRLLQYQALWVQDPPDRRRLSLYLVTDVRDSDLGPLLAAHHITYVVI